MFTDISLPFGLALRVMQPRDDEFAEVLFASTRDYLYAIPAPKPQVDFLIKQQFQAQQAAYTSSFPQAETLIIEAYGGPIGKIVINNTAESLHVIDVALMKDERGKGFGSALLHALKRISEQQLIPLSLMVDHHNVRAKKLYIGLGFVVFESSATHDRLLWR
ncbi:MAG: GNAT family N-acetyltransferase [Gammaproteobacteria bacterium]|nr:GNAT family N-acetyltransferase [Gammaproteobacteria bacterium]